METRSQSSDIISLFNQGLDAHAAGNLGAAKNMYQEILAIQPDHPEANHNVGIMLVAEKEFDKALSFFKFALNASPNVSLFWASYIDALVKLERIIEAKALIKEANNSGMSCENIKVVSRRLDIENQEPLAKDTHEIDEFIAQKKLNEAIEVCLKLMETYPSSAILNIALGKCYFDLGQTDQAISSYTKATKYWPQSEVGFAMLGQIYSSCGNTAQAVENLSRAVELKPNEHELNFLLGVELTKNDNLDQAISYLKKANLIDPNSSLTLSALGTAFKMKHDQEQAITYYTQALKLDPQDPILHFNMGTALFQNGSLALAIAHFRKAVSIRPDYADAYFSMGNAQKEKGDLEAAIESFKQAIEIKPDYPDAINNMGVAFLDIGDSEAAIMSFKKVLVMQPDDAEVHNNMGIVLNDTAKYRAAIENYRQAIKINPNYASAYNNMAITLKNMGETEAAIEVYKKSLNIDPECASTYHGIGSVFIEIGDMEAAIAAYKQAIIIEPDHLSAQHLLAALTGENSVSAPNKYIEGLFDKYSIRFEDSLVQELEYNLPKIIGDLLWKLKLGDQFSSMLDLGCGTGLVGIELKALCQNIEGIDLSRRMLKHASDKNVYDKLDHVGIVEYLSGAPLDFDLIVAADVFVYVGELSQVFELIKLHNKRKGWLIFSTEHTERDGFFLEESGRYSHSKLYIESLCEKFEYQSLHFSKVNLRKERNEFLTGGLYVLKF